MTLGLDQATELRTLARRCLASERDDRSERGVKPRGNRPHVVTLCAGKEGVGVSTIALQLAICLAEQGRRVVLVDAAMQRADLAYYCGLEPNATIADVLAKRRTLSEVLVPGPAGIRLLPGFWSPGQVCDCSPGAQEHLLHELSCLGERAELILLDVGNGMTQVMQRFWQASDAVLTLFTPQTPTIMDGYAMIKTLHRAAPHSLLGGLVNFAPDQASAERISARVVEACQRFCGLTLSMWSWLPADERIAASAAQREPWRSITREGSTAVNLATLAEELCRGLGFSARTTGGTIFDPPHNLATAAAGDYHDQSSVPIPLAA